MLAHGEAYFSCFRVTKYGYFTYLILHYFTYCQGMSFDDQMVILLTEVTKLNTAVISLEIFVVPTIQSIISHCTQRVV